MTLFAPVNECNIFSQWVQEIFGAIMFFYFYCLKEPILKSCQSESYLFRIDFLSEETCPPAKN